MGICLGTALEKTYNVIVVKMCVYGLKNKSSSDKILYGTAIYFCYYLLCFILRIRHIYIYIILAITIVMDHLFPFNILS